jgi:hypothetical protein
MIKQLSFASFDENFAMTELIPFTWSLNYCKDTGRRHVNLLPAIVSALLLQKLLSIPTVELLITFLNFSEDLRNFCGLRNATFVSHNCNVTGATVAGLLACRHHPLSLPAVGSVPMSDVPHRLPHAIYESGSLTPVAGTDSPKTEARALRRAPPKRLKFLLQYFQYQPVQLDWLLPNYRCQDNRSVVCLEQ